MRKHLSAVTRRELLQWGATAAAGICAGPAVPALARVSEADAFEAPPLSEFGYAQVHLDPGPLLRQFEENHQLLLNMSEDSLLRPFRVREGLPAPGAEMGGWYNTDAFAPACPFGQWLSALSRFYAATGNESTRTKIDRLIRGYDATIDPAGKFYQHNRFPAYTYDKLVCGLSEAHDFAGHPTALHVLARATDAVSAYLPARAMPHMETPLLADEDFSRHVWDESYTMPENLFLAWRRTDTPRYLELAKRFLFNDEYFDPLSRGENVLPGRHAYSHMNALGSAAAAYLALGDAKYLRAARNAFAMVQEQSYATGGWGPDEHFITPGSGKLGESLNSTHASFETPCGAYAHFKIARYLLRITRDSHYGDSMERVMYNTVLGARPIKPDGATFYYSDYTFNATKFFHRDKWPCCSGTLPQIAADYGISTYFRDQANVYVNLYVPSMLNWQSPGANYSLRQITDYPYDHNIRFELAASSPATFSVFMRIPEWARGASLTVNGMRDSKIVTPGSFAEIRRQWKTGDRIELSLPLVSRLEAVDAQHPDTVALVTGPLVLMSLRKSEKERDQEPPTKHAGEKLTRTMLLSAEQTSSKSHKWTADPGTGMLSLKPFLDIQDETYSAYQIVSPG